MIFYAFNFCTFEKDQVTIIYLHFAERIKRRGQTVQGLPRTAETRRKGKRTRARETV